MTIPDQNVLMGEKGKNDFQILVQTCGVYSLPSTSIRCAPPGKLEFLEFVFIFSFKACYFLRFFIGSWENP